MIEATKGHIPTSKKDILRLIAKLNSYEAKGQ
jgi:hypothetical protein